MKTKKIPLSLFMIFLLMLPFSLNVYASSDISAQTVSDTIRECAPLEFGYVDNTEYYMQYFFGGLSFVDDSCIVVSAESTNFNEFGVFHVASAKDVKKCEKILKNYVEASLQRFKNGVMYDVGEYPKFENAAVIAVDDFVIYMILTPDQSAKATQLLQNLLG